MYRVVKNVLSYNMCQSIIYEIQRRATEKKAAAQVMSTGLPTQLQAFGSVGETRSWLAASA